jgi:hypothetical protein
MNGQYVLALDEAQAVSQILVDTTTLPAGSWVLSLWAYALSSAGYLNVGVTADWATTSPTIGALHRITALGPEESDGLVPEGGWHRFFVPFVTAESGVVQISIENANTGFVYVDAAKLEYEPGLIEFLNPSTYSPDATASATIVRELRADNIVAGTLTVGGSDSNNPVIEVYDAADTLIVTIGEPSGGFRGIEVLGEAGIKVQPGGTVIAGAVELSDTGIAAEVGTINEDAKAYTFRDGSGNLLGGLYGYDNGISVSVGVFNKGFLAAGYNAGSSSVTRSDRATSSIFASGNFGDDMAAIELAVLAGVTSVNIVSDTLIHNGVNLPKGAASVSGTSTNDVSGADHTHAVDAYSNPGTTANRLIKTGTSGAVVLADLTTTTFSLNGRVLTAAISGALAIGAGNLSGISTNDVTINGHTHAIDAYDTPGANANRIIKTGTAGLVTLASLTATTLTVTNTITTHFTLGGFTLTAAVSGAIATGAGTLTTATTNNSATPNHTHAIATSSAAANSTIVATDSSGEFTAKLKSGSTIAFGGWTDILDASLTNSWVWFGSAPWPRPGYYKDQAGMVHMRGLVKNGTINTTILTLPAGFRPANQTMFVVYSSSGPVRVDIATTGAVTTSGAPAGSYTYLSLDNIHFQTS